MIKLLEKNDIIEYSELTDNHFGRKLFSYYQSYGTGYDFCRFYKLFGNDGKSYGVFCLFNSTMIISSWEVYDRNELISFIRMTGPEVIEGPLSAIGTLNVLTEYDWNQRTMFEFRCPDDYLAERIEVDLNPDLDKVYSILKEGFTTLGSYDLWLTDTSHRIRRNVSRVYLYKDVCTASVLYDINDSIFIAHVATKAEYRGKGLARELLYWLCSTLQKKGKRLWLFAREHRVSYYRSLGFREAYKDIVLEKKVLM